MRAAVLSLPVRKRVPALATRPMAVTIAVGGSRRTVHLSERADFTTMYDVFGEGEYDVELPATPRAIIDLGAHVGMSVLFFRERYPAARILAVEPNPANFAKLERNVGGLPDVELRPVAVGGEPGTAWLDVGQESWRSMLVRNPAGAEAIRVPVSTLDELVADFGCNRSETLLKVDVEGAEWDVLSRATDLTSFLAVLGDLHRDLLPVPPERFFGLFEGLRVEGQDTTSTFRAFREVR
jgi:FkbM family methyltransferase